MQKLQYNFKDFLRKNI